MKTILLSIACALLLSVSAQQDSTTKKKPATLPDGKYCVTLVGGQLLVHVNGKLMGADMVLKNGLKLTTTGTLIKKDGTVQLIKPGTCVNSEGNETEQAKAE